MGRHVLEKRVHLKSMLGQSSIYTCTPVSTLALVQTNAMPTFDEGQRCLGYLIRNVHTLDPCCIHNSGVNIIVNGASAKRNNLIT